jgi:hypothetical protein
MGLDQMKRLLHSKGDGHQNEEAISGWEKICKSDIR